MEYNKPVSNPMLVGALQVLKAEDTPEHRRMFLNELVKARFMTPVTITPIPDADELGQVRLTPENKVMFPMLSGPGGGKYFMAFTDKIELANGKEEEEQQTVTLTFQEYAGMILPKDSKADGFVLNPREGGLVISREMIASFLKAR